MHPNREEVCCIHCGSSAVKMPIDSTNPLSTIAHCTACNSMAWNPIITEEEVYQLIPTLPETINEEWRW